MKQKLAFSKKCKNMSSKQENVSDATFKTWPFPSDFNFASNEYQVMAATCKYYPLAVSPTVTNCCEELHLKYGKIPRSIFENFTMHENQSSFVCQSFFILFRNVATFIESH